jgi:hypothetical protein
MSVSQQDPKFDLAADLSGFFREVLTVALEERRVHTSETTAHYLVGLLADFAHPDELAHETFERPLPVLLEEALNSVGRERFDRLRTLGDTVLYTSGFFLDHLQNRGVELSYVSTLGARAYGSAATMLRGAHRSTASEGAPELFDELADKFHPFAEVLATVADGLFANSAATSDSGIVKAYERWLRSGSTQLAGALASRGVIATRGRGGVH